MRRKKEVLGYGIGAGGGGAQDEIVGIVMLEVGRAEDLPKLKNSEHFLSFISIIIRSC